MCPMHAPTQKFQKLSQDGTHVRQNCVKFFILEIKRNSTETHCSSSGPWHFLNYVFSAQFYRNFPKKVPTSEPHLDEQVK